MMIKNNFEYFSALKVIEYLEDNCFNDENKLSTLDDDLSNNLYWERCDYGGFFDNKEEELNFLQKNFKDIYEVYDDCKYHRGEIPDDPLDNLDLFILSMVSYKAQEFLDKSKFKSKNDFITDDNKSLLIKEFNEELNKYEDKVINKKEKNEEKSFEIIKDNGREL